MAIQFQYNKTSLQALDKNLKMRVHFCLQLKTRKVHCMEVKKPKTISINWKRKLNNALQLTIKCWLCGRIRQYIVYVEDVRMSIRKIAGECIPVLEGSCTKTRPFSLFNSPKMVCRRTYTIKGTGSGGYWAGILCRKAEFYLNMPAKNHSEESNLFEKVQIPGYEEAITKIKRFMEDEENLSKSSQKIVNRVNKNWRRQSYDCKMKKYSFLVYHKQYVDFSWKLRGNW